MEQVVTNEIITMCSSLLGTNDTTLLTALYNVACFEFTDYCNRDDIPENAKGLIVKMVCALFNKKEAQGLSAQSFSGVSETFIDGFSDDIIKQLNRYRKFKMI